MGLLREQTVEFDVQEVKTRRAVSRRRHLDVKREEYELAQSGRTKVSAPVNLRVRLHRLARVATRGLASKHLLESGADMPAILCGKASAAGSRKPSVGRITNWQTSGLTGFDEVCTEGETTAASGLDSDGAESSGPEGETCQVDVTLCSSEPGLAPDAASMPPDEMEPQLLPIVAALFEEHTELLQPDVEAMKAAAAAEAEAIKDRAAAKAAAEAEAMKEQAAAKAAAEAAALRAQAEAEIEAMRRRAEVEVRVLRARAEIEVRDLRADLEAERRGREAHEHTEAEARAEAQRRAKAAAEREAAAALKQEKELDRQRAKAFRKRDEQERRQERAQQLVFEARRQQAEDEARVLRTQALAEAADLKARARAEAKEIRAKAELRTCTEPAAEAPTEAADAEGEEPQEKAVVHVAETVEEGEEVADRADCWEVLSEGGGTQEVHLPSTDYVLDDDTKEWSIILDL